MITLRDKIIRLAYRKPELRPYLLPLLKQAEDQTVSLEGIDLGRGQRVHRIVQKYPGVWSLEPKNRQPLDYEAVEEDDWRLDYANPMQKAAEAWLVKKYGRGVFELEVSENGGLRVWLTSKGKQEFLKKPSVNPNPEVVLDLKGIDLGPGGGSSHVEKVAPDHWVVEPSRRQRQDHYRTDDPEAWWEEYGGPVSDAALAWLERKYGRGLFRTDVSEKGYLEVYLTPAGKNHLG